MIECTSPETRDRAMIKTLVTTLMIRSESSLERGFLHRLLELAGEFERDSIASGPQVLLRDHAVA